MKNLYKTMLTCVAIGVATPAWASIVNESASASQGTLVHGTGTETTALEVVANLGSNGPNIVHVNGNTDGVGALDNLVRMQGGSGQADFTGAEITPGGNPEGYNFLSGNIFLTDHAGMSWIEFALTGEEKGGTVDFYLTDGLGVIHSFLDLAMGSGNTHFGFSADGGDVITNVYFVADSPKPGTIDILKQIRINQATPQPPSVPEPATWAMMLMGFGGVGFSMRRRRRGALTQIA